MILIVAIFASCPRDQSHVGYIQSRQAQNVELTTVLSAVFGNAAVKIQDHAVFIPFFNWDWPEGHEDLRDAIICDRLFLAFYFVSEPRFTQLARDLISFGNNK